MNLNKVIVVGNLTRDPETRSTPSGQNVTTFSIATNRIWTDQTGQKKQVVEYHNIVAWGKLADICSQYLARGRLVLIEGRLQTRTWESQDGAKRNRTEIIAENMQMGPRPQGVGFEEGATPPPPEEEDIQDESPPITESEPTSFEESQKKSTPEKKEKSETEEEIKVEDIPF